MTKEIKPGTVCMIVNAPSNNGKIVTAVRLLKAGTPLSDGYIIDPAFGVVWEVDTPIRYSHFYSKLLLGYYPYSPASCLQPLDNPPDDAVDETLLWLPVPQEEREYEIQHN